ncbi:hypothetical protein RAC92_08320 [Agrobacterium sp. CR_3]|uniref:hypothetical protein n=1 Tax=Agrobacterium sp. CR_3 TaxID=3055791 RepID=UPI0035BF6A8D
MGARVIGPLQESPEVQLVVGLVRIDTVVIDLTLDAEAMIKVADVFEQFKIKYLFASINAGRVHPDQIVLSPDITDLANIA